MTKIFFVFLGVCLCCLTAFCEDQFELLQQNIDDLKREVKNAMKYKEGSVSQKKFLNLLAQYKKNANYVQRTLNDINVGDDIDFVQYGKFMEWAYRERNVIRTSRKKGMIQEENIDPDFVFSVMDKAVAALKELSYSPKTKPVIPAGLMPYLRILEYRRLFNMYVDEFPNFTIIANHVNRKKLFERRLTRMLELSRVLEKQLRSKNPELAEKVKIEDRTSDMSSVYYKLSVRAKQAELEPKDSDKKKRNSIDKDLDFKGRDEAFQDESIKEQEQIKEFLDKVVAQLKNRDLLNRNYSSREYSDMNREEKAKETDRDSPRAIRKEIRKYLEEKAQQRDDSNGMSAEQYDDYRIGLSVEQQTKLDEFCRKYKSRGATDNNARKSAIAEIQTKLRFGELPPADDEENKSIVEKCREKKKAEAAEKEDSVENFTWK